MSGFRPTTARAAQLTLIDVEGWRERLWAGMPEFVCEDIRPLHSVWVHFDSMAAVEAFEAALGQMAPRGRAKASMWYPAKAPVQASRLRYAGGAE